MLKTLFGGIAAGFMVGIGGTVYLAAEHQVVGAVLFSVALLTILFSGMYLFTGKIGLFAERVNLPDALRLPIGLVGNWIGAVTCGLAVSYAKPSLVEAAKSLCQTKIALPPLRLLLLGAFCGVLMYAAVKPATLKTPSYLGVLFAIPTFILCGFEHSIADIFYFTAAGMFTANRTLTILLVVIGNTLGGMLIPALLRIGNRQEHREEQK